MENLHLHFALNEEREYFIQANGKTEKLLSYAKNPGKLAEHQRLNAALAAVPQSHLHLITYYAENLQLPRDEVSRISVVSTAKDPNAILPDLVATFMHASPETHERVLLKHAHQNTPMPLVLSRLGIKPNLLQSLSAVDRRAIKRGAAMLIDPPLVNAQSIVFSHPEIGSLDDNIMASIFDKYLQDHNDFTQLINYISSNPDTTTNSWYKKSYAIKVDPVTLAESPMEPTEQVFSDGKQMEWPVDPLTKKKVIPQYELSDEQSGSADGGVITASTGAIYSVLKKIKNDEAFKGSLWSRPQGIITNNQTNVASATVTAPATESANADLTAAPENWSIKYESTLQYGLELVADGFKFENNTISFPVNNWPNRILSVYIEYQTADGTPIPWSILSKSKEGDGLVESDALMSQIFATTFDRRGQNTTKLYWGLLGAGNNVFGIPFPTQDIDIRFKWPHTKDTNAAIASRAKIYLGGFGGGKLFSDWDTEVDLAGLIATGILNYGVTAASMAFTIAVLGPMKAALDKSKLKIAVIVLSIHLGIAATVVSIAFWKNGNSKMVLSKLSNFVASFLFGQVANYLVEKLLQDAIEDLAKIGIGQLTTQQLLQQVPYAGWALKAISVASDVASLAATTIQCLGSPATYEMQIQNTMDLTVTVKPDPSHGTESQDPIWPMVGSHYVTTLKYPKNGSFQGGMTYVKAGPMPGSKSAPIVVTFSKVPAGGQVIVTTIIYSSADWIAGRWDSGPKAATPDLQGKLAFTGSIIESLVPLTSSTSYREKQRVGFDAPSNKHKWIITSFSIDQKYKADLESGILTAGFIQEFNNNGISLPQNIVVTKVAAGIEWNVEDRTAQITYRCLYKQIYSSGGSKFYQIEVQNVSRPAPVLPNPKTVPDTSGSNHNLAELVGMTINNKAYQLGYAWRASGMNMPRDKSTNPPENNQLYAMQSISTLAQPSDLIIQSNTGFTQMPFIAYNQFGLTPLFMIDFENYQMALNNAESKALPAPVKKEFTERGFEIPAAAVVKVIKPDKEWRIIDSTQTVIYDLVYGTEVINGAWKKIVNIYNYVIPEISNFYLDPRPDEKGHYHLRAVSFHDGLPGSYNFDVDFSEDGENSWGAFPIPRGSTLYKIGVHPAGCVIAIDYALDKIWSLQLPNKAVKAKTAPIAMPMSGSGNLEGLLSQPKAMTISSDGRIIILEQGNKRFQSFDVTGNPVAGFKGELSFTLPDTLINDLNGRKVTLELRKAYQTNMPASYLRPPITSIATNQATADNLDKGIVNSVIRKRMKTKLCDLPEEADGIEVIVNVKGKSWLVVNKTEKTSFDFRWNSAVNVLDINYEGNLEVDLIAKDGHWKVRDKLHMLTFEIKPGAKSSGTLRVQQLIATALLRTQTAAHIEYLDVAVEDKGYIYVLYFTGTGASAKEYMLDIYNPDGTVLLQNPLSGIAAAKMAIDKWRTLWTLNYETFLGPNNRTEPGVSGWIPSTPSGPSDTRILTEEEV